MYSEIQMTGLTSTVYRREKIKDKRSAKERQIAEIIERIYNNLKTNEGKYS